PSRRCSRATSRPPARTREPGRMGCPRTTTPPTSSGCRRWARRRWRRPPATGSTRTRWRSWWSGLPWRSLLGSRRWGWGGSSCATPRVKRARRPPRRRAPDRLLLLARPCQRSGGAVREIEEGEEERLQLGGIADPFEAVLLDPVGEPVALGRALAIRGEL